MFHERFMPMNLCLWWLLGWQRSAPAVQAHKAAGPRHILAYSGHTATCCLRSAVEQLVEASQTRAIADALLRLRRDLAGRGSGWAGRPLAQVLDGLEAQLDERVRLGGGSKGCDGWAGNRCFGTGLYRCWVDNQVFRLFRHWRKAR
jgi:hypothetical protein